MHIIITCTETQQLQWLSHFTNSKERFTFKNNYANGDEADAYFYLLNSSPPFPLPTHLPVFINSQSILLSQLPNNCVRLNAWEGFLENTAWEISASALMLPQVTLLLLALNKPFIQVPDIVGFVSSRAIAMIINEAYFALAEGVSNKQSIDIAMKLGTNYPYGPFEWCNKIGLQNVVTLLQALQANDDLYTPCPLMLQELSNTPCP